jgi:Type I phosphodiesterase / nucleotide pyrophosphatase
LSLAEAAGPDEPVVPAYGSMSLTELLPSVAAGLGLPGHANTLGLPVADRVCILLVDGLGALLLERAGAAAAPTMHAMGGSVLTTGVPSTTVTSLACLGTGRPAGSHGMVGYTFRLQGHGLLNALKWSDGVDPLNVQPGGTLLDEAAIQGVEVSHVGPADFEGSGLTQAALRGATYRAAATWGERVAVTDEALRAGRQSLVLAYVSDLDATGHRRGAGSPHWAAQLRLVDALVEGLLAQLPAGALLLVTGDHGMVDVDLATAADVEADSALSDGVALLGGEPRFRHVYAQRGAAGDVLAAWRARLRERAWVLSRDEAIAAGWFGDVSPTVRGRIGDVVAAARGRSLVLAGSGSPHERKLPGQHGSLTAEEMLVPLLVAVG